MLLLLLLAPILLSQAYSVFGSALAPAILPRATICNGQSEFCNRSFGNITYVGAHDSYAIGTVSQRESNTFKPFPQASVLTIHIVAANQDQNGIFFQTSARFI
jgi:hypothetical protein